MTKKKKIIYFDNDKITLKATTPISFKKTNNTKCIISHFPSFNDMEDRLKKISDKRILSKMIGRSDS